MKTLESLATKINNFSKKNKTLLIAIDGRGGSGKSTLAKKLQELLPNVTILHIDDFLYPHTDFLKLRAEVIIPLKEGRISKHQTYDWETKRLTEWKEIKPGGIVLIEGVRSLHDLIYRDYDFKIWIECPAEIGFQRGFNRDVNEYNQNKEIREKEWRDEWMPGEKRYINSQKPQDRADYIVDGTKELE